MALDATDRNHYVNAFVGNYLTGRDEFADDFVRATVRGAAERGSLERFVRTFLGAMGPTSEEALVDEVRAIDPALARLLSGDKDG